MLNRATNILDERDADGQSGDRSWQTDAQPNMRLATIVIAIVLPLMVVGGRLVHLQVFLQPAYVSGFEMLQESVEPIPARNGRILGGDGQVLAYDVEQFDILAHYRWLEEPADELWLKRRALSHLSTAERRKPELVQREKDKVLAERDAMWARLADLSGQSPTKIAARRKQVQDRIERMIESIEKRRKEREAAEKSTPHDPTQSSLAWYERLYQVLALALTTPPHRVTDEAMIYKEETEYFPVVENVSLEATIEVEAHPEKFPGLQTSTSFEREYPSKTLAAHLIGSRGLVANEEFKEREKQFPEGDPLDFRVGDSVGRSGVEESYDRQLRGLRGLRRSVRNRHGEIVEQEIVRNPRHGRDVILTLHIPLQQRVEELLDTVLAGEAPKNENEEPGPVPVGGAVVVLDVHSGQVVCAASAPRFDLELMVHHDEVEWKKLLNDRRQPFFHRAIGMTVPPGSVFKPLTAVALLESGQFDPEAPFHCQGYLERPDRFRCLIYRHYGIGHNETNLSDALAQSCNVYFYHAARGLDSTAAGSARLISRWADRFGYGHATGIDIRGEMAGNLPNPVAAQADPSQRKTSPKWNIGETLGLAIGQSRLTVTPMQVARMMAAIGNGGYMVVPHLVRGVGPAVQNAEADELATLRQSRPIAGLSPQHLLRIQEGLYRVVNDPKGTGYKSVRLDEVEIAGKTGTAEVGGGLPDHAWFAGYVPADQPRYAFAVVLEHAGSGGRVAGPLAKQVVEAMLEFDLIRTARLTMRE